MLPTMPVVRAGWDQCTDGCTVLCRHAGAGGSAEGRSVKTFILPLHECRNMYGKMDNEAFT